MKPKNQGIKVTISSGGRSVETTPEKMRQLAELLKHKSPQEVREYLKKQKGDK